VWAHRDTQHEFFSETKTELLAPTNPVWQYAPFNTPLFEAWAIAQLARIHPAAAPPTPSSQVDTVIRRVDSQPVVDALLLVHQEVLKGHQAAFEQQQQQRQASSATMTQLLLEASHSEPARATGPTLGLAAPALALRAAAAPPRPPAMAMTAVVAARAVTLVAATGNGSTTALECVVSAVATT
jgi:hypothetical protein